MKKLLIFIALIIFASCEKNRDIECYTCRWETKVVSSHAYYSYLIDTCLSDVESYEAAGTWKTSKAESKVTCWKRGEPWLPNPGL
jgi:hypothetical protein